MVGCRHYFGGPLEVPVHPFFIIDSYLLENLIGRYQGNGKFVIRGRELTCTVEDFGRILSVSFTRESINMNCNDYENSFYDEHLHSRSMTR